jgi:hypothetical protein
MCNVQTSRLASRLGRNDRRIVMPEPETLRRTLRDSKRAFRKSFGRARPASAFRRTRPDEFRAEGLRYLRGRWGSSFARRFCSSGRWPSAATARPPGTTRRAMRLSMRPAPARASRLAVDARGPPLARPSVPRIAARTRCAASTTSALRMRALGSSWPRATTRLARSTRIAPASPRLHPRGRGMRIRHSY